MRSVVDADRHAFHELATQPTCHERQQAPGEREHERGGCRRIGHGPPYPPADEKERHHNHVADAVQRADALGSRAATDREPVDEPEHRREEAGNDPGDDHIEGRQRPCRLSRHQSHDVEDHRHREYAEG